MTLPRAIARFLCACALLLAGGVASAGAEQATLGADGVLYTARVGTYSSLFPNGKAQPANANVLALEIQEPGGKHTRLLAPGGELVAPDAIPFVLWEDASRRLFLVWEGLSHIHSAVRMVSYDGVDWSQPLQISGNPFTKKSSPRLAITRETYLRDDGGEAVRGERTVLHVVWYEDDYGDVHVLYAPVALDNGATPQLLPPIFDLGLFVPEAAGSGAAPSAALLRSPRVVAAADQKSVLVALLDDATDQLATLRIDVLPVELSIVADELERFFAVEENDPCGGDVGALAERARAHLVVIGTRFSAYARSFMADAVREWLLARRNGECSTGGRAALAERARAHLVVIGRRALHEVIVAAEEESSYLLTFDGSEAGLHNDLSLSVQRAVTSPPALAAGPARIHIAGSGRQSLVSWKSNGALFYQEHNGASWQPRQSLALSESFTLEQAYSLLDGKAR
jgi:hypothetical protein